jgi:NADPH oxidase 5
VTNDDWEAAPKSWWDKFRRWWTMRWTHVLWTTVLLGVNAGLFGWRFAEFSGLPGVSGWVSWARGCGMMLSFDCAVIFLPMCRGLLTYMRRVPMLVRLIPLDWSIEFHKIVAILILLAGVVHGIAHFGNYSLQSRSIAEQALDTNAGLTGVILWIIMAIMFLGALPAVRRSGLHHVFFYSHLLYVAFVIILLIHGADHVNPSYWKYLIGPGTLYVIERAIRYSNTKVRGL